jgi:membrane fusion protein, multidrug efflux system
MTPEKLQTPPSSAPPPAVAAPPVTPAAAPSRHPPHFLRWALWCAAAASVIVAVYFGTRWWTYRTAHSITEDAFLEAHIVNVAPEMVSGRIVRFLVDENDHVEQGQVLAEIEPVHYSDEVAQALGKLDLADAELRRQKAGLTRLNGDGDRKGEVQCQIEVAEKTVDEADAAVAVANANLILAKQDYDRFTTLAKQDAAPTRKAEEVTRTHEAARAELRLANARLDKARKALDLAKTGYDQIHEFELMVEVKKELVKDAQTALDTAKHIHEFTQVRAPFPGVVVKRYRNLGDCISAGTPILSMYNPDLLYVTANLEENRLHGVAPGNHVELTLDAFDMPFHGRVVWINKSTGAQFALMPRNVVAGEFTKVVQRVPVRIWIEKDERWPRLRSGLSAHVDIAHGDGDSAWAEQTAKEMADAEMRFNVQKK